MKNLIRLATLGVFLVFATDASAISLGSQDVLVGIANFSTNGSSEANEEAFFTNYLTANDPSLLATFTYTKITNGTWFELDGYLVFDFHKGEPSVDPEYFMVKIQNGIELAAGLTDLYKEINDIAALPTHFLYDNLQTIQYAVIDPTDFIAGYTGRNKDIVKYLEVGMISHVAVTQNVPVPEPGTLLLLGSGLLGLGLIRRRRS